MKYKRFTFGIILILLLSLLMLYYSLDHNNHDPDIQYILENLEQFNTTKVVLIGQINIVDRINNTLLIEINQPPRFNLLVSTTNNLSLTKQGDIVEIYGIINSKNHVNAEKIIIYQRWKYDLIFVRSLPAIPFALYLLFRTRRFNLKTYRFERRQKNA